jgi:hypothetical protein
MHESRFIMLRILILAYAFGVGIGCEVVGAHMTGGEKVVAFWSWYLSAFVFLMVATCVPRKTK